MENRRRAKETLAIMREYPEESKYFIGSLRKHLDDAKTSLESIGSNDKEIEKLLAVSKRAEARKKLARAFKKRRVSFHEFYYLLLSIIDSGLTLKELETNKKELIQLEKRSQHPVLWPFYLGYESKFSEKFEALRES